jgi:hypothetical protein
MRKWRWLGIAVLVIAGCQSTNPDVKPKHQAEDFTLPPREDARYNTHMTYPNDTLFSDVIKKDQPGSPGDSPKPPSRFGGGPGGGPGGF